MPRFFPIIALLTLTGCQQLIAYAAQAGLVGLSVATRAALESRTPTQDVAERAHVQGAPLAENFTVLDGDLRARGYEMLAQPRDATLAAGAMQEAGMRLDAGQCYAVAAVGDSQVRDLVLGITDASGHLADGDASGGDHPVAHACVTTTGVYTVHLLMRQGQGAFRFAAYRWTRGTHGPFGVQGLLYVRVAEATALLGQHGYEPDPDFTPVTGRMNQAGEQHAHRLQLPQDACVIVVAVGGSGVQDVNASLDYGAPQAIQDHDRNPVVALEACSRRNTRAALTLASGQGQGDYFVQVFRREGTSG